MRSLLVTLLTMLSFVGPAQAAGPVLLPGVWRARLDSPGGELPFRLVIKASRNSDLRAFIHNAEERIEIPTVTFDGKQLVLRFDHYDSEIRAKFVAPGELSGQWSKVGRNGELSTLSFSATVGDGPRFRAPAQPAHLIMAVELDGQWLVDFESSDVPALAILKVTPSSDSGPFGKAVGTFLTTTGDYRYLEGDYDYNQLRLSCFDGAHAFLFKARANPDGTLEGDFWSRDTWHETWTAVRDPDAALPDAFKQTPAIDTTPDLASLVYTNLDGNKVSLADLKNPDRPMIVEIFGSWCPNCHDAAAHLADIQQEYRKAGLVVVGLAFELNDDMDRSIRQVRAFRDRHDIRYPLLIAGKADKQTAAERFPLIDRVRSYPTAVFIDARGEVRAVHTGYAGPATGHAHTQLKQDFNRIVREMLDEVIK